MEYSMLHALLILTLLPMTLFAGKLAHLEKIVKEELKLLDYPPKPWRPDHSDICDVAIIGAGQSGCAIAYALRLEGVHNVQVFDASKKGKEGPWLSTARMKTLRSGKNLRGPCLNIPHLTFRAWYEAQHGKAAWKKVAKIPTKLWGKYLQWVRSVLNIEVNNAHKLRDIVSNSDATLTLVFENGKSVSCRQLVLATGRAGFGGFEIPEFIQGIPKKYWAHTGEEIHDSLYKSKKIAVLGVGASSFDAAAACLENGAKSVDMLARRVEIPTKNLMAKLAFSGVNHGFYFLPDKERIELFSKALDAGIPPPIESVQRVEKNPNFTLRTSLQIQGVSASDKAICFDTNQGCLEYDYLILATGYAVDANLLPELSKIADSILLWGDVVDGLSKKLAKFPYLGQHFEFVERCQGTAPSLSNIYCFNYGAFLSHGRISGDIDCVDVGIKRLVDGIVIKLYLIGNSLDDQMPSNVCPGSCQVDLERHCDTKK